MIRSNLTATQRLRDKLCQKKKKKTRRSLKAKVPSKTPRKNSPHVKNEEVSLYPKACQKMLACLKEIGRKKYYKTYRGVCRVAGVHWLVRECSTSKMSAK